MNKTPLKVLYIEDDEFDADLVEAQLSRFEFEPHIHRVEAADELKTALASQTWDVILADYSLPSFGAVAALEILKESGKDLPFIVVSGTIGEERAIEMMKAGAQDFILKGDFARLLPAIRREISEASGRQARRVAERELSLSETRFKELADAMPQLVWTTIDDKVTYVNAKWRDYFGTDETGDNWFEKFCYPGDISLARTVYAEGLKNHQAFELEFRLRGADGNYRWFLSRGIPSLDRASGQHRWFGTCTDIEDAKKRAEKESFLAHATSILSSSLDYQKTLANLAGVVVERLADWCTIDMIDAGAKPHTLVVAHRDPAKIAFAHEWQKKFPTDWSARSGAPNVLRTGIAEIYPDIPDVLLVQSARNEEELKILRELGLRSVMIVPLKHSSKVVGTISFLSTNAENPYSIADLSFAEDLARRASLAIENAELYRRAESANRAKTDFLANMSHEIRTPLGAMLGFAELLADPAQSEKDRLDCVAVIRRNGAQLAKLIDEILDLAKIESSRLEMENTEFSLLSLIEEVTSLLSVQAEAKGIRLLVTYLNQVPAKILSDATRVRQVLLNLIGNAIKFTPAGEVKLTIRSHSLVVHGPESIEISVRDSGIGMTRAQASRLFQPFVQADNSMTRKFGGTGLGLALSRKLAESLGGSVTLAHSEPERGSEFIFTMIAGLASTATTSAKRLSADKPTSAASLVLTGKRVLVVDDAPDNRVLVARYLTRVGAYVDTASDGALGAEKALAADYHVVLMDLQMPNVDGFAALEILKAHGYKRPVVALTAHAMQGDREKCLETGFSEHLSKPIDSLRLVEMIRDFSIDLPIE